MFPIHIACYDTGYGWIQMARQYQKAWFSVQPRNFSWYCYDVTIISPTQIKLTIYDMADNFKGGIGKNLGHFWADVDASLTADDIQRHARELAESQRQAEIDAAEDKIITAYQTAILTAVYGQEKP